MYDIPVLIEIISVLNIKRYGNIINRFFFLILVLFLPCELYSQSPDNIESKEAVRSDSLKESSMVYHIKPDMDFVYDKPGRFQFFKYGFSDFINNSKNAFKRKNITGIAWVTAVTALMVLYDQPIIDRAQDFGDRIHLSQNNYQKTYISAGNIPLFQGPTDLGTALYFLGDGWTHLSICGSYLGYGLFRNDNRALQTASQLAEGLLSTALVTQLLKHITGRESPWVATAPAGVWRLFPDPGEYQKHTPHYDAYPSGHLATAMMTVTVIAENYAEYKFIRPLGYTLMGLLSYQMMNNGVHWISDYPLSLVIGYYFAKSAVKRGRKVINTGEDKHASKTERFLKSIDISPYYTTRGSAGLTVNYRLR